MLPSALGTSPPWRGRCAGGRRRIDHGASRRNGCSGKPIWHQYARGDKGIETSLASIKPILAKQGVEVNAEVFRPASFIDAALSHLRTALLVGAALVIAVLFLFLLNVRTAVISAVAIPLSLLVAIIVLTAFGVSLNTMTLGGLAIALGEVVDDAIIDVENIYRRLRQNQTFPTPQPAYRVVLRARLKCAAPWCSRRSS